MPERILRDTATTWRFYQCSACLKTYRTWKCAANHITRVHDGQAIIEEHEHIRHLKVV